MREVDSPQAKTEGERKGLLRGKVAFAGKGLSLSQLR